MFGTSLIRLATAATATLTLPAAAVAAPTTDPTPAVPPVTNLQAVVDPIAVKVDDGIRVRIGMRNAGPRSITAPAGTAAAWFTLYIVDHTTASAVRSVGGCGYVAE